jgi:hypothetical protein
MPTSVKLGQTKRIDMMLQTTTTELDQINIEDQQVRKTTLTRLDPKLSNALPSATGNFEAILKTLPGVASNNELSSQYSVRGGNFDENLVYVNDVEIYRPLLTRSGQQEGLSFINSDMVSSVLFSAGGFEPKYGDKMSSALDIKYRKPTGWGGAASASLLGFSGLFEGCSQNKKFTHITGVRYQSTKYVLNTLETEGDYDPRFLDFQTYLTYAITNKLDVSFLGNLAKNKYTFIPQTRTTRYGTVKESYELKMYFDGQEVDQFLTGTGAVTFNYKPTENLNLKLITSAFSSNEKETFTIQSQYLINQIDNQAGSESQGDSIANLGIGAQLENARNYLTSNVYSVEHRGIFSQSIYNFQWGLKAQNEQIDDNLKEYMLIDSAGFSLPVNDSLLLMNYYFKAKNNINSNRLGGFVQGVRTIVFLNGSLDILAGVRASYWTFNQEFILSPRVGLAFKPAWEHDFMFRFSTGYYYQPAFYKEMRNREGQLNSNIKSQKSIHFVLGSDYNFTAWGRPFKWVTEVYYKILDDLITYQVDNVRIIYSGQNDADGYAVGVDTKVNGEFVKGVDSWLSVSVMKTMEDVYNDGHGYIPRPTDQRLNVGLFFQDYFPNNPDYKMNLQINVGSGLPFGPPNSPRYMATGRSKPYQRVDIGFSKILKREGKQYPQGHWLCHVKDAWIALEVFNLMDRENTISYEWVTDIYGRQYAVDNSLTGRRVNLKLSARF